MLFVYLATDKAEDAPVDDAWINGVNPWDVLTLVDVPTKTRPDESMFNAVAGADALTLKPVTNCAFVCDI